MAKIKPQNLDFQQRNPPFYFDRTTTNRPFSGIHFLSRSLNKSLISTIDREIRFEFDGKKKKKTQPSNLGEKCQILIYSSQNNTILIT